MQPLLGAFTAPALAVLHFVGASATFAPPACHSRAISSTIYWSQVKRLPVPTPAPASRQRLLPTPTCTPSTLLSPPPAADAAATAQFYCARRPSRAPCEHLAFHPPRCPMHCPHTLQRCSSRSTHCAFARFFAPRFCFKRRNLSVWLYRMPLFCYSTCSFECFCRILRRNLSVAMLFAFFPKCNTLFMYLLAPDVTHLRSFVVFIQVSSQRTLALACMLPVQLWWRFIRCIRIHSITRRDSKSARKISILKKDLLTCSACLAAAARVE